MKTHAPAAALAALCLVSLAACDGETSLDDALKQVGDAADKVSNFVDNLDTGKVKELAELAAEIEKDPSKATDLLEKAGMSRSDFDKAVKAIQDNPELAKVFAAAKKLASE